jgi:beta-lactam-binding protein with PASTA domain/serine/threonine protein kinase
VQSPGRASALPGAVASSSGDPLVGRLLEGRYRIGPRIARGGMAGVYEATDLRLDRQCAVKVMHAGLGDDEEFAARFVREARSAARLDHPNVVAVFDQGDDDGTVFLVMEHVAGHTLRDVIRKESPMAPLRALALVEPVLSALAHAHRAGLIHRDVKPENVLIATDPDSGASRVKVADFGLAKAVSADTQHTATGGVLIGTVSYLAPELVVDGRSDARADVYAVGVLLYELLTGTKPHEGESPIQVAYKHVHEDVPPPSRIVPDLPAYVDALVARATARDLDQRPADAGVLLHQVHRVAQALRDGVQHDDDLTADLALARPWVSTDTMRVDLRHSPEELDDGPREDTEPDPFDLHEFAQAMSTEVAAPAEAAQVVHRTSALDRRPVPPPRQAARTTPARITTARRPRRSRRGPVVLLLALLLVVGAGIGAWWFGWARYTSAPGLLGLSADAAEQRLDAAGLDVALGDGAYSETVPKGRVLSADPSAGERVLDGGTVTLVISLGKERYDVPRTKGLTEDQAQDALLDANLAFGKAIGRWSETVPEGVVLRSDPPAGKTLRPDTVVDLYVSKGRQPLGVKDWTGKDADQATAALERKGFEVTTEEEYSDDVAEGDVISQDPSDGTLFRGDEIELVVSLGPELVEVPGGLRASGWEHARDVLEAAGFDVQIEHVDNYLGLGFVYDTDPDSGAMVPQGTTVTLFLI